MEALSAIPTPDFEISYNGKVISRDISPYLLGVTYTDHLTGQSDELDIELEDTDGRWLNGWYPDKGATLALRYGYEGQSLVSAGSFEIDEVGLSGPPSLVRIRALATGVQKAVRTKSGVAYEKTTLAVIAARVAKRHKMKLIGKIEPIPIDRATQFMETDLQFLYRLARSYGYAFKVTENNTKLVFWRSSQLYGQAAIMTLRPSDLSDWTITDKVATVSAASKVVHHNRKTKKLSVYGVTADGNVGVVAEKTVGTSRAKSKSTSADTAYVRARAASGQSGAAQARAELERRHIERTTGEVSLFGNTRLLAGTVVALADFGRANGNYLVIKATHKSARNSGYTTSLELKRANAQAVAK